jgi:hypothetical protein
MDKERADLRETVRRHRRETEALLLDCGWSPERIAADLGGRWFYPTTERFGPGASSMFPKPTADGCPVARPFVSRWTGHRAPILLRVVAQWLRKQQTAYGICR